MLKNICEASARATNHPQRRCAELAEHQDIVQEYVADQRKQRGKHDRSRMPDAFGRKSQREKYKDTRRAKHDGTYISDGLITKFGVDADDLKRWRDNKLRGQNQENTEKHAEINALASVTADEFFVARSEVPCGNRRDGH